MTLKVSLTPSNTFQTLINVTPEKVPSSSVLIVQHTPINKILLFYHNFVTNIHWTTFLVQRALTVYMFLRFFLYYFTLLQAKKRK